MENTQRELTLEEKKAALLAELAEIQAVEDAEKFRLAQIEAEERAKEEYKKSLEHENKLFLSLQNQPLYCGMPITNRARFKVCYKSKGLCSIDQCFFAETCAEIAGLMRMKKGRKRSSVLQNPVEKGRNKNTVKYEREISKGMIILTRKDTGEVRTFTAENWKKCTKQIREHFRHNPVVGLTDSAIAGFTHKGPGKRYEKVFMNGVSR